MAGIITSIPPLVEQPPGQTSSNPAGLPGVTYTAAVLNIPQTWTAKQTFPLGNISLNAADITGTLPFGDLPFPSSSTLGGIQSIAAVAHNWINSISTAGVPSLSQPAFADISGSVAATQLPNPSATTLGGIQSLAAVASKWINTIATSGAPSATQPAFTDISGQATLAQLPTLGANTVLGSIAGGAPIALSTAQYTSLVNAFTTTLNGSVPNPGTVASKFLRDDGTWQTVSGSGTVTNVATTYPMSGGPITTAGTVTYVGPTDCGQLTWISTTALAFKPYKGDTIKINGVVYQIPLAGIAGLGAPTSVFLNGVAAQTLAINTTYFIYAFNNAGTITADFSTTTHGLSSVAGDVGTEVKNSDATRALIGMVRTGGTVIYASDLQTASWFNRRRKTATPTSQSLSTSTSVNSTAIAFVTWAEEAFTIVTTGAYAGSAPSNFSFQNRLDASSIGAVYSGSSSLASASMALTAMRIMTSTEGNHSYDGTLAGPATTTLTGESYVETRG